MKNVGVPETPERSAESTSWAMRPAPARARRSSSKRSASSPSSRRNRGDRGSERVLAFEQQVVHLPERALLGRGLRRLGCLLRVRVDVVQRQVPPDVGDVAVVAQQLADDRFRLAAVGALEVAVLETVTGASADRARGPLRIDRIGEIDDQVRRAEQRADPLAPREPVCHGGGAT